MGIKLRVLREDLPERYREFSLSTTEDGATQTVYLLDKKFVIKIFSSKYPSRWIDREIEIYRVLHRELLPIPEVVDRIRVQNREALIYTQIEGESPQKPNLRQIESIGEFLRRLHDVKLESNYLDMDRGIFSRDALERYIENSRDGDDEVIDAIKSLLQKVECYPDSDTLIHGDLFVDNSKFIDNRLSGVFDFSEASMGDRYFDLAVTAISWCRDVERGGCLNNKMLKALCQSYSSDVEPKDISNYIEYATLFYAIKRYFMGRNYKELLDIYFQTSLGKLRE
jgi:homoserine kinase type II